MTTFSNLYQDAIKRKIPITFEEQVKTEEEKQKSFHEEGLRLEWLGIDQSKKYIKSLYEQKEELLKWISSKADEGDLADDYAKARLVEMRTLDKVINLATNGNYE